MSEFINTSINLNIGQLPETPSLKFSASLGLGGNLSSKTSQDFYELANQEIEQEVFYLMIEAKSHHGARRLVKAIKRLKKKLLSDEELSEWFAGLKQFIANNEEDSGEEQFSHGDMHYPFSMGEYEDDLGMEGSDDDEFMGGEEMKFTMIPFYHENKVIVKFKPTGEIENLINSLVITASNISGDQSEEQKAFVEFDFGKTLASVAQSEYPLNDFFDSARLKMRVKIKSRTIKALGSISGDADEEGDDSMGFLVYLPNKLKNMDLNLNLKSASEMEPHLKHHLKGFNRTFRKYFLKVSIPEDVKRFLSHFDHHGSGKAKAFMVLQGFSFTADLEFPGVTEFISGN
jgi:hypothetical protein